jgi:hypothetical protein
VLLLTYFTEHLSTRWPRRGGAEERKTQLWRQGEREAHSHIHPRVEEERVHQWCHLATNQIRVRVIWVCGLLGFSGYRLRRCRLLGY